MEQLRLQYLAAFAFYLHISPVGSEAMECSELVALTRAVDTIVAAKSEG